MLGELRIAHQLKLASAYHWLPLALPVERKLINSIKMLKEEKR